MRWTGMLPRFAEELAFDLDGKPLALEDLWINILPQGGIHTSHIHPQSVISGTAYVAVPADCAVLKLEDPETCNDDGGTSSQEDRGG